MLRTLLAATGAFLLLQACSSVRGELSRRLLQPPPDWLVTPGALGRPCEPFAIELGSGSLTGWFLPAADSRGRTVLLFQGGATNASMMHPYYTFLVDAGLNVCVFDYRGFGRSEGEPSLRSLLYDTPKVLEWLRSRPDVDPQRIAYFGIALGSTIALHTAVREPCAALVVESVQSPGERIRAAGEAQGGAVPAGFLEWAAMPEGVEPQETAARLSMPSLWIAGAGEPAAELRASLRAYWEMGGEKQLWVLPETGAAPHSLLTHDGEYQRAVAAFLCSALDGAPGQVAVRWRRGNDAAGGGAWWEIELERRGAPAAEPWAVQVCALDAEARATFQNTWLAGERTTVRVRLPGEPGVVGAAHLAGVEPAADGSFQRTGTPLSRAGRWYEEHAEAIDLLRNGSPDLARVREIAAAIAARDRIEPPPPQLEAELADVHALLAIALHGAAGSSAEERAAAAAWLERARGAVPEHPERHFWPGRVPTFGFAHAPVLARAERALAAEN